MHCRRIDNSASPLTSARRSPKLSDAAHVTKNRAPSSARRSSSAARRRARRHPGAQAPTRRPPRRARAAASSTRRSATARCRTRRASSGTVSSSRNAANATFALNSALCFVRFAFMGPLHRHWSRSSLAPWSSFWGPLLTSRGPGCGPYRIIQRGHASQAREIALERSCKAATR